MFKAQASEVLAVLPVLRDFVHRVIAPTGLIPAQRTSFLAACDVVDAMDALKKGYGDAASLARASETFLRMHTAAYGVELLKPKHHFMLHMHEQAAADGHFLDCFCH